MGAQISDLGQSIALMVQEELTKRFQAVPAGISNRHVHLCREDMDALFGRSSQLTVKKMLLKILSRGNVRCSIFVRPTAYGQRCSVRVSIGKTTGR